MQLEANPKDSELYRLRKQHLKSMISLKYDIERLKQEQSKDEMEQQVEMMKKEHDRREWVLKQQQQPPCTPQQCVEGSRQPPVSSLCM